ncbi:uncharacterized protein [Dysidea avara]|uniref:uncharacterized protein isoform X2 n=1 Tax=Dysidea avara TaxID=196820 RepID=UPI00331E312E
MGRDTNTDQLKLPPPRSYACRIGIASIPKLIILGISLIIAAYLVELYFAPSVGNASEDQPVAVCDYYDDGGNYYGYRICINMMSAAMINIFQCITMLLIDLFIPCLNSRYTQLSQLFTIIWAMIMAVYMLITSALIANLYTRYCDDATECQGYERKFIIFPVFGFFLMVAWC